MMRRQVALLALGVSLLLPHVARADGSAQPAQAAPASPAKKAGGAASASAAPAMSPKYRDACTQGNTKYAARDFAGAIESYRAAIELDPKNPFAHYLLGEAQLAAGNMTEAEAAWNRAALQSSDKDAVIRARVLFVLADLKERQKKWDEAKAAWQVYLDWAAKYPNSNAYPSSGQSRQQVIDTLLKLGQSYAIVRQRIADSKAGNVFSDLSKQPPAPPSGQ